MTTGKVAALGAALMLPAALLAVGTTTDAAAVLPPPAPVVTVSGTGVASYPAFDPGVSRYAVTTTEETGGEVTVAATEVEPGAVVYIDGVPEADGEATLSGLVEGDEIAVWIEGVAGVERYSYVYLPPAFPTLETQTAPDADLAPGAVMLGLSNSWLRGFPGQEPGVPDYVETAVDRRGVPLHVESFRSIPRSLDLKRQPDGHYSVARTTTTPGRTGEAIIELDERFREVARHETIRLDNTDGHDAILLPDGTAWLMAYEHNDDTGLTDSVIQRIDPDGTVGFQWSSAGLEGESVAAGPDYAHLNSFELMADGDLLASFRNLSSVFKIATSAHDGFEVGDVVWKLGGRDSTFAITDQDGEPDGGPCAQHSAHELPDGDIVLYDNGSSDYFERLCLTPGDPSGATVQRVQSRALTLHLDAGSSTAEIVRAYEPGGRFAWFAGSTQPLAQDHLLIGWASATAAVATELDAAGDAVWELRDADPDPDTRFFSYRAHLADVSDATPPVVSVDVPAAGATYVQDDVVAASYRCTDRGGSSLQTCASSTAYGKPLDTRTPGRHTMTVTATDGAGTTVPVRRTYTVLAAARPDAQVRVTDTRAWTGQDRYGASRGQRVATTLRRAGGSAVVVVRLQNDGARPDRLRYSVTGRSPWFRVTSPRLAGGTTPVLQPGTSWTFRVRVVRRAATRPGARVVLRVPVRSGADGSVRDAVSVEVTARR